MSTLESAPATFTFGNCDDPHAVGDPACSTCWNGPWPCGGGCPGLVHTEFGDENADCDYWLYSRCDACGSDASAG